MAGYEFLKAQTGISAEALDAVRHHHEYLDGSGYPDALCAESITDIVRMLTISDIFAALIEHRQYKPTMPWGGGIRHPFQDSGKIGNGPGGCVQGRRAGQVVLASTVGHRKRGKAIRTAACDMARSLDSFTASNRRYYSRALGRMGQARPNRVKPAVEARIVELQASRDGILRIAQQLGYRYHHGVAGAQVGAVACPPEGSLRHR
ncbi:hypothetical protein V1290_005268 [Bradyrhizobium sp. AZCC 1578]